MLATLIPTLIPKFIHKSVNCAIDLFLSGSLITFISICENGLVVRTNMIYID